MIDDMLMSHYNVIGEFLREKKALYIVTIGHKLSYFSDGVTPSKKVNLLALAMPWAGQTVVISVYAEKGKSNKRSQRNGQGICWVSFLPSIGESLSEGSILLFVPVLLLCLFFISGYV